MEQLVAVSAAALHGEGAFQVDFLVYDLLGLSLAALMVGRAVILQVESSSPLSSRISSVMIQLEACLGGALCPTTASK